MLQMPEVTPTLKQNNAEYLREMEDGRVKGHACARMRCMFRSKC